MTTTAAGQLDELFCRPTAHRGTFCEQTTGQKSLPNLMVECCSRTSSCKFLAWCVSRTEVWQVLAALHREGCTVKNWHVGAFMPLSRCSQGAPEECHNAFFSPTRACPCHTPGRRSQGGIPLLPSVPAITLACDSYSSHSGPSSSLSRRHIFLCCADATKTTAVSFK